MEFALSDKDCRIDPDLCKGRSCMKEGSGEMKRNNQQDETFYGKKDTNKHQIILAFTKGIPDGNKIKALSFFKKKKWQNKLLKTLIIYFKSEKYKRCFGILDYHLYSSDPEDIQICYQRLIAAEKSQCIQKVTVQYRPARLSSSSPKTESKPFEQRCHLFKIDFESESFKELVFPRNSIKTSVDDDFSEIKVKTDLKQSEHGEDKKLKFLKFHLDGDNVGFDKETDIMEQNEKAYEKYEMKTKDMPVSEKEIINRKGNDISSIYRCGNSDSWPMNLIHNTTPESVPPFLRKAVHSVHLTKEALNGELGLQINNDEVMSAVLSEVLCEILNGKNTKQSSTVQPKRVLEPQRPLLSSLNIFQKLIIPYTIVHYPSFVEGNGTMSSHLSRLASFKDWPMSAPVSALRLVDSGFYLKLDDNAPAVSCFSCGLQILYQELEQQLSESKNIVLNMHLTLSPNCSHAQEQLRSKQGLFGALYFPNVKQEASNFAFCNSLPNMNKTKDFDYLPFNLQSKPLNSSSEFKVQNDHLPAIVEQKSNSTQNNPILAPLDKNQAYRSTSDSKGFDSGYRSRNDSYQSGSEFAFNNPGFISSIDNFNSKYHSFKPSEDQNYEFPSMPSMPAGQTLQQSSFVSENVDAKSSSALGFVTEERQSNMGDTSNVPASMQSSSEGQTLYSIKHPDYATLESRMESFSSWPFQDKQDKSVLVLCGYFYTGTADIIRCFSCDIGLAEWDEDDDPWTEHARHSPNCRYLKLKKGDNFINGIQQEWRKIYNPKTPDMQSFDKRLESFNSNWPVSTVKQTPYEIAMAGFYYTGEDDAVRCHYCDGGLREWEEGDEPWTEHARWFPFCKFIMKIKGINFIEEVQKRYELEAGGGDEKPVENGSLEGISGSFENPKRKEEKDPLCTPAAESVISMGYSRYAVQHVIDKFVAEKGHTRFTANDILSILLDMEDRGETIPNAPSATEKTKSVKETSATAENIGNDEDDIDPEEIEDENKRLREQLLCVKCKERDRVMVFIPCGHRLTCKECSDPLKRCIKCKKKINKKVKTYLC